MNSAEDLSFSELDLIDLDRELLTHSFRDFARDAWATADPGVNVIWNWHQDAICDHLQAVAQGDIRKLLITVPPGHAKSMNVSVLWPSWVWTNKPQWKGLFGSYAAELAIRDSVRCRTVVESSWYKERWPEVSLASDQNVKSYFQNTQGGFRLALGVGGKATGFRGDCVCVDDALNATDTTSEVARANAIDWWDRTMATRINDPRKGAFIVIMQRLHEEDLAGHVMRQGGYEVLSLPSEFEPRTRSRTYVYVKKPDQPEVLEKKLFWEDPREEQGELLFPQLFTRDVLADFKKRLGSYAYAGQFLQRPSPEDGLFRRDWWRFWKSPVQGDRPRGCWAGAAVPLPEKFDEVISSWDCAFKDADTSDYVVGTVWGRAGALKYLLHMERDRLSFTNTVAAIRRVKSMFPKMRKILIEDKANGSAVIDTLKKEIVGIVAVNPEGGKEARAAAVQPQIEANQVFLPDGAPWLQDFIEEFAAFPNGLHDDIIDSVSQALLVMFGSSTSFGARYINRKR